jgi:hypothetical protein
VVFQLGDWVGNCNFPIASRHQTAKCVRPRNWWVLVGAIMSFGLHLIMGDLVPPPQRMLPFKELIKFGGRLLPFGSESFVFPSLTHTR